MSLASYSVSRRLRRPLSSARLTARHFPNWPCRSAVLAGPYMRQVAVEVGKDVEISQDEVAARQPLIVLVRYVLDDGVHREV
jgi:hypothetical protein